MMASNVAKANGWSPVKRLASLALSLLWMGAVGAMADVENVEVPLEPAARVAVSTFNPPGYPAPNVPECPRVDDTAFEGAVLVGASTAEPFGLLKDMPPFTALTLIGLSPHTALQNKLFPVDGQKMTLRERLAALQPTAVYLWLGVNGLDYKPVETVLVDYDLLLNQLIEELPATPLYIMGLTPVKPKLAERYRNFTNEKVIRFNEGLLELAQKHNVYFLPLYPLLCDSAGELCGTLGAGDGLHLRAAAYAVLSDYLYTHMIPIDPAENGGS